MGIISAIQFLVSVKFLKMYKYLAQSRCSTYICKIKESYVSGTQLSTVSLFIFRESEEQGGEGKRKMCSYHYSFRPQGLTKSLLDPSRSSK